MVITGFTLAIVLGTGNSTLPLNEGISRKLFEWLRNDN